ncbi:geranylgeranylglyceryl/heptaprenylglyceryl phosphate synthase [Urechidicola vernalis]|uniref:Geranylgeranylglyceryl phosphate synthase n=1 Tax=Urechidicola vernalis TaxID=3075600 RepID=A0ABU2Y7E4_9FLAO|nr:geranylgeranylglyceryl/heptaprenylglyceryl phosphate synthase [Urechidicola sp. P050]MDT0553559.1 geranylgeranylglyceryl/heptaprenylglyceryl phosphate synthase [Urechidicola sp. P050]
MQNQILNHIKSSKVKGEKMLAILLDPDKLKLEIISEIIDKINNQNVDLIFVGGSTVQKGITDNCIKEIKKYSNIPVLIFPGDYTQLTDEGDAVLFLSLLSGNNPEYLVHQQVKSAPFLKNSTLEIIPTGYILIDGGKETAVQRVSKTLPIPQNEIEKIINTALAAQYMGKDLVYLEAGSGATEPMEVIIIKTVSMQLDIPLIVGGGIRTKEQLENAYKNGADVVVIGTAFEENLNILQSLK